MNESAKLEFRGQKYELPIIQGSENELGIDINHLRDETGLTTYDVGFKNTSSTKSQITYIDGDKGVLRYRGYPIEQLAEYSNFLEVSYLLVFGELPTANELINFKERVNEFSILDEELKNILNGFPRSAHPMGMLSALTCSLTAFYPKHLKIEDDQAVYNAVAKLLAKLPILAAWIYCKIRGFPLNYADVSLDYASCFLKLMFDKPNFSFHKNEIVSSAMDKLLILHGDHEQNCSTSTVRIVGSSHAGLFASIASGVSALWGPLHGGANQAVLAMLEEIKLDGSNIDKYLNKAKDKSDPFRLMGFGHRVYKNFDPRAKIIKKAADNILDQLKIKDPILEIAKKLEKAALEDEYFIQRKLFPNVDFYSGIIFQALDIPKEMFTVIFALGRLPGWISQWLEMRRDFQPIGRPRQIYTGHNKRDYIRIDKRK